MIILEHEQGSQAWHDARRAVISSTRVGRAIGSPAVRETLLNELIAEEITGETKDFRGNDSMVRGTQAEIYAVRRYQAETGSLVQQVGFCISEEFSWLGWSPDGLVSGRTYGDEGAVEIKSPNSDTFVKYVRSGKVPKEYEGQVKAAFLVKPDLDWLDFVVFDPRVKREAMRLSTKRVYRKDLDLAEARTKLLSFREQWLKELDKFKFKM